MLSCDGISDAGSVSPIAASVSFATCSVALLHSPSCCDPSGSKEEASAPLDRSQCDCDF